MKHFNRGHVWGKVAGVKQERSDKGTPYLSIMVDCSNDVYGNVRTYGRLWGEGKSEAFRSHLKDHPHDVYQFTGFFSQYEKDGRYLNNYTFISWKPSDTGILRASFILIGDVIDASVNGREGVIDVHLIREGRDGYDDIEEDFTLHTMNPGDLSVLVQGATYKIKGLLRTREPDDVFGDASGPVQAYAMMIEHCTGKQEGRETF